MIGRLRGLVQRTWRRPRLGPFTLALLALVAITLYLGAAHFRRYWQRHAVQQALDRRDFAAARARLGWCLESWPADAEFHLLAARARRDGDYEAADRHLGRCRQLRGDEGAVTLERALLAAQRGEPDRVAVYLLSRRGERASEAGLIDEALARGYLKTDRPDEAPHCLNLV